MIGIYLVRTCLGSERKGELAAMQELRVVDVVEDMYSPVIDAYIEYLNRVHSDHLRRLESSSELCYAQYEARPYPLKPTVPR